MGQQEFRLTVYSLVFTGILAARVFATEPAEFSSPVLPPGLAVVQLDGNMICPPVLLPSRGILVACDDRTINLIGLGGHRIWRLEMDRFIRGPLFSCTPFLTLVSLTGEQIAAVRSDGSLAWQKRFPGSEGSWFFGSPEGRIVQVDRAGDFRFFNPDGSPLFLISAKKQVVVKPNADSGSIRVSHPDGTASEVTWAGGFTAIGAPKAIVPQAGTNDIHFSLESKKSGEYQVSIIGPNLLLEFNSHGSPGHWLVDNGKDPTVVWGDSLWRCFVFHQADSAALKLANERQGATDQYYFGRLSGPFENLSAAAELELRYLNSLVRDDPVSGSLRVLDHIAAVIGQNKLAGRLHLYEDFLAELLASNSKTKLRRDPVLLQRSLNLMAQFPSIRSLARLVELAGAENDPVVLNSWLAWLAALGTDNESTVLRSLLRNLPRWQARGTIPQLKKNLGLVARSMAASWPQTDDRSQFLAWAQIPLTH